MNKLQEELAEMSDASLEAFYERIEPSVRMVANMQSTVIAEATSRLMRGVTYEVLSDTQVTASTRQVRVKLEESVRYCTFAYSPVKRAFGHFLGEAEVVQVTIHSNLLMPQLNVAVIQAEVKSITVDASAIRGEDAESVSQSSELNYRAYVINEFACVGSFHDAMTAIGYRHPDEIIKEKSGLN